MDLTAEQTQLIAFVERDYEVTHVAAGNAQSAVVASRSIGFTLFAALFGLGLSNENLAVLVLAALSGAAVYFVDGYYTWRASERDLYMRRLEGVLSAYYVAVQRKPDNTREVARLQKRLTALRVGTTSQIRTFRSRDILFNQPGALFMVLYPILFATCLFAVAVVGIRDLRNDDAKPSCEPVSKLVSKRGACAPEPRAVSWR